MRVFTEEGVNVFAYLIHTYKLNSCAMGRGREGGREGWREGGREGGREGKKEERGEGEQGVHQTTHFRESY